MECNDANSNRLSLKQDSVDSRSVSDAIRSNSRHNGRLNIQSPNLNGFGVCPSSALAGAERCSGRRVCDNAGDPPSRYPVTGMEYELYAHPCTRRSENHIGRRQSSASNRRCRRRRTSRRNWRTAHPGAVSMCSSAVIRALRANYVKCIGTFERRNPHDVVLLSVPESFVPHSPVPAGEGVVRLQHLRR